MPEWKRNLLRQKEMKKNNSSQQQQQQQQQEQQNQMPLQQKNGFVNSSSQMSTGSKLVPDTPELMKHNMFIKKSLAAS